MAIPFQPYAGDEAYAFVCYAHEDEELVREEIDWLHEEGIHLWYDRGIQPGTEWLETLAGTIQRCKLFLFFVTPRSVVSENCRRELNFAMEEHRDVIAVHLVKTDVPPGLRLILNNRQAIHRYQHTRRAYDPAIDRLRADSAADAPMPKKSSATRTASPAVRRALIAVILIVVAVSIMMSRERDFRGRQVASDAPAKREVVSTARRKAMAVLPFRNMSPDAANAYFAAGVHEEIINRLGRLHDLAVISRTSVMHYQASDLPIRQIAGELQVGVVMEGSVRFSDEKVRISINLIDAIEDRTLWSEIYEKDFADIFLIQDEIARNVVETLEIKLLAREAANLAATRSHDMAAYGAYLMGLAELSRYTPTGLQAAISHFSTAIELDPALVDARLYLVECFQSLFEWQELPVDQMRMLAEPQIERALEVDPDSARAHSKLGIILAQSGDVEGAERAMQRAVTLNPNSARVREEYARVLLNYAAKPEEALDQIDAAAMLEPLARSRVQQSMRGRALGMLGRAEEAMRQFDALMAAFPDDVGVYVDLASVAPTGSEAMRWWRLCAERAPTVAACPAVVAGLLMNYDQYDEAERWLNLAARRDPDSGWIWIMRFFLRARLGDESGMEAATDRAIEYGSRASGAEYLYSHRHLRWLLARDPERVEAYYRRYYPHLMNVDPQVNPRTYAAAISLAFLLVEQGELARSQTLLDRSLLVVENTPEAWFLTDKLLGLDAKAMIYTLQGDHDRALTRLTQQAADDAAWNWQILEGEPIYRRLHEHPKFQELLSKLRSSDGMALEMSRVRDMEEKGLILPLSAYPEA